MFKCDHAVQCCSGNSCHCWHWLISNLPVWISASFERWRREPLGGLGACLNSPPPLPPARKFWNLGAQKCSCKHFPWHFSSEKSILGKCRSSLFYCLAMLCQVNDHLHFQAFEIPLLTVQMKQINLIKMLVPSIHPPYFSWVYRNQSNFF